MHKLAIFAVLLLVGCDATQADPAAYWRGRGYAAVQAAVVTLGDPGPNPGPTPGPTPIPEGECPRCGGDGRIKPDGRIEIDCPDCGGDGITDPPAASTQPPQPEATATPNETPKQDSSTVVAPALHWVDYLPLARTQAEASGKNLLIYVTADYCTVCKRMEQTTYTEGSVIQQLNRFVLCRLDANDEYPGSGTVEKALRVDKLPYFVITNSAGKVLHQGAIDPAQLLTTLEAIK